MCANGEAKAETLEVVLGEANVAVLVAVWHEMSTIVAIGSILSSKATIDGLVLYR